MWVTRLLCKMAKGLGSGGLASRAENEKHLRTVEARKHLECMKDPFSPPQLNSTSI